MQIDLQAVRILNSRLFHDLVGTASAIDTGLEFLEDAGTGDEALSLIQRSSARLSGRLDLFRAAFGQGGGAHGLDDGVVRSLLANWYADAKPDLHFPESADGPGAALSPGGAKILLILAVIAEECLPRGGTVNISVETMSAGEGIAIDAAGPGAKLPDGMLKALTGECGPDDLTAWNIMGFFVYTHAQSMDAKLQAAVSDDHVQLAALAPPQPAAA